ncbi:Uncharacterized protein FKW44_023970 [Caligus rogercresseyi]|uniref:Xaa-Pro aminopeptidase 1 n=1 Tax=Caligus rogercresseyi TaxID=217165 RepID=A0A7T8GPT2_CALRO|nr:Uncharacterized protein FKW44_023970 [Caligus rogercresseyi]
MEHFVGTSFTTISGSGPNAAVIHYRPKPGESRVISRGDIYLVDSGGQYKDGTTDVTRTVHMGSPSSRERECFTRLTTTVFPKGIMGYSLDAIARTSLWKAGLDYVHGTGHGVGSYLNVHEGPMRLSSRYNAYDPGLEEGMNNGGNKEFLTFENLTLVPIQKKLIEPKMLTKEEVSYINDYHMLCKEKVGPLLKQLGLQDALNWLNRETEPLG